MIRISPMKKIARKIKLFPTLINITFISPPPNKKDKEVARNVATSLSLSA